MNDAARRTTAGALLSLSLLPLAACGGEEDADLTVYVGRDEELVGPLIEDFEEESGLTIDARYADTPDQLALLLEEGEDTPADVFLSQDAGALGALSAEGLTTTLPEKITGAVDAAFTSADDSWVGVTGRARVIAYNPDNVEASEVPDNVAALTEPEWSGRVGLAPGNASFQAFVTGFRVAEGDEAAQAWLEAMAANEPEIFDNNVDILDALEAGTLDLGLTNHYYLYELAAEIGEDEVVTELVFPRAGDPGALVNVTGAAILDDSDEAQEFAEFLVSEDAQTYFSENTFEYPLRPGVAAPEGLPGLEEIEGPVENLADLADLETTVDMIDQAGLS